MQPATDGATQNPNSPEVRLHTVELVVSEMDTQLHHLHQVVAQIARTMEDEPQLEIERGAMRDQVWACGNCSARLGIYNADTDELRVRYKDFVAYIRPGVGGSIMVPCRRCGERNSLADTRAGRSDQPAG